MAKIKVQDLYKIFGEKERAMQMVQEGKSKKEIQDETGAVIAVSAADFEVREHEIFVIMGLSGSGKSTLLRCINRLIDPTQGSVTVDDQDVLSLSQDELRQFRQDNMSMVFQHFGLLPHRSVLGNVEFGMELRGVPVEKRRRKAQEAVEMVGLEGFEHARVNELSGGMQQRVGLARALAPQTPIMLMDEAFSALDPLIRNEMHEEFLNLQKEYPRTILFISHDLNESLFLGDRVAIMKEGAIVRLDEPEEILIDPQVEYVEAFVENVDRSKVITAKTIMMDPRHPVQTDTSVKEARRHTDESDVLPVLDENERFVGLVTKTDLEQAGGRKSMKELMRREVVTAGPDQLLADLLLPSADTTLPIVVLDDNDKLLGWITRKMLLSGIQGNRMIS
jgi:glycine betaine/proline transport system ATP-binding protein